MSDTKHTPGPWSNTPGQCTIWANDGDLKVATVDDLPWIETASGRRQSDWMTEAANARLIAAAPELLEACKLLLSSHTNADAYETACDKVRLVVAKAEGKL